MVSYVLCSAHAATTGALCESCRNAILDGEQRQPPARAPRDELADALIDDRGRVYTLDTDVLIGRTAEANIAILDVGVSRRHACVEHNADGIWLRDLGSVNGTFVNNVRIVEHMLRDGDRIRVGSAHLCYVRIVPARYTVQCATTDVLRNRPSSHDAKADDRWTLLQSTITINEPTGGGGGLIDVGGRQAQVTTIQLELVRLLARRMADEHSQPRAVRGFVRTSEILGMLPWDTHDPREQHVIQLVRRTRRTLQRHGLSIVLEGRHGFGYRMHVSSDSAR